MSDKFVFYEMAKWINDDWAPYLKEYWSDAYSRFSYRYEKRNKVTEHFCDEIPVESVIQSCKDKNGEIYRYMQSQAKVISELRISTYIGGSLENAVVTLIKHWGFSRVMTELAKKAPR